ncbi:ferric reductase like transmembrane component-domain-containing protein [Hypoxylon trugodes]|uniref:ferric reductase like transmembrane component-domain-containing protein n=1 Tax=Hypoxylon trugodes TaxID=326681 RepID=UPI0021A1F50D|nr:ferric reductase like transmembrane component-domain-containing protein [Hypoxylon trugodes]KAI1384372.1 ferric reductase like transmembrane component-domain-containing protein [Hypoxylon trugodes]
MDMDSMSDMSGDDTGINKSYAKGFWYLISAAIALFLAIRAVNYIIFWSRLRRSRTRSVIFPTRPTNQFSRLWATLTAVAREMSYPQFYVSIRNLTWMTPPPMGCIYILMVYWAVVVYMIFKDSVKQNLEILAYRNAWVTVTQVPLLYLLASRTNVIALVVGTSYERLNWLHRWVARTMFITATAHGWVFWYGWAKADILDIEFDMMGNMVNYGLAAWGILLWMTITSFKPFRSMAYEFFVIQHILAAIMFLWAVYVHVPASARYNVWFAISALCFDRACRIGLLIWQNLKFRPRRSCCEGGQWIGHQTQLSPIGESITVLTIKDVHFKWRAGQHLYLWLPRVAPIEVHPYTIASAHQMPDTCICNSIQLVIRSHSGFSRRLNHFARKLEASGRKQTLTAMVIGPYGHPPRWNVFETLVFISASTGASYTLPILESVLNNKAPSCTKRVDFLLAARHGEEIGYYHERLLEAIEKAKSVGIELAVYIAVTGDGQLGALGALSFPASLASFASHEKKTVEEEVRASANTEGIAQPLMSQSRSRLSDGSEPHVHRSATRPDVSDFIRAAVEATGGETGVVVCGGQSLVAKTRTSVARISDERAVHKGTGAQGIFLHVEEYCF